ncbi:hypothetical protein XELAEV_18007014mg [Xenopus laevis]|uniref:Uncharacterized protein n=1 Tax=Xenopus laevis TaxID=8355 RepID=A0A974I4R4_XENLA|nr:hypothetical protein XELAEV_18007014mg [Xenopus laevis]
MDLRGRFLARGYPLHYLKVPFVRAFKKDRSTLLMEPKDNKKALNRDTPMFITTYCKQYREVKRIVKKYPLVLNGDVTHRAKTLSNFLSPSDVCAKTNASTWLNSVGSFNSVVSRHFSECNNGAITSLKIKGIKKVFSASRGGDLVLKLLHREAYWIFTLETRQLRGLMKFDVLCSV